MGTLNRTGKPYLGSFDVWTRNHISHLADITASAFEPGTSEASIVGWVNGNDYEPSNETFGILPLSESSRMSLGMQIFKTEFVSKEKTKHANLSKHQQTLIAVLPVHTPEERALFSLFTRHYQGYFANQTQPNWVSLAREWSSHANGLTIILTIFYKVLYLLYEYFRTDTNIFSFPNT